MKCTAGELKFLNIFWLMRIEAANR